MRISLEKVKDLYYNKGLTQDQIAKELSCSPGSIQNFMARHSLKGRTSEETNIWANEEIIEQIYKMYDMGYTKEHIAKKFNFKSITPINNLFKKQGIHSKGNTDRRRKFFLPKEELETLYLDKTALEISKDLKLSASCIDQWLDEYQIEKNIKFGHSYPAQMICEWLDLNHISYVTNDRKKIYPKEIDIYIEDYKLGIEINGIYWHRESKVPRDYHLVKTLKCEESGIQLLHFWDYEIKSQFDIVVDMISSKLNLLEKIGARKCNIVQVSSSDANLFFKTNHLQGSANSSINIGLEYQNELVCLAGFSRPRYDKRYDLELIRFACKKGVSIVGGFSKIISTVDNSIISYANRRWSSGIVYKSSGWDYVKTTNPGYSYFINNRGIYHRSNFQKHKLKHLSNYSEEKSEYQIMRENGHDRIWDCGNLVFKWTPSK